MFFLIYSKQGAVLPPVLFAASSLLQIQVGNGMLLNANETGRLSR